MDRPPAIDKIANPVRDDLFDHALQILHRPGPELGPPTLSPLAPRLEEVRRVQGKAKGAEAGAAQGVIANRTEYSLVVDAVPSQEEGGPGTMEDLRRKIP
jgi:hypothetical protein